jgi:hypothetical protein
VDLHIWHRRFVPAACRRYLRAGNRAAETLTFPAEEVRRDAAAREGQLKKAQNDGTRRGSFWRGLSWMRFLGWESTPGGHFKTRVPQW